MASIIHIEERMTIPAIESLADFRRWALSDEFPESCRIDYLAGLIEVDMSPEDLYTHGTLKAEIASVIHQRTKRIDGQTFIDCTRISFPATALSVEPDVLVVMNASLASGKVGRVPKATGERGRFIEFEGSADLIVEIVSDGSAVKDIQRLPAAYFAAGVTEFWLADARHDGLLFQIHRRGKHGFEPVRADAEGYQFSEVLGQRYRLQGTASEADSMVYDLKECDPV